MILSGLDLQLVGEYVEKLERGPREYRLCFYQRDWLVGQSIPACILNSINDSKRVIILMTNNFINSSWGLFEFRSAIRASSMDKDKRLIVILYPGVDLDKLDPELKLYMKFNTYLRRDDPHLPSRQVKQLKRTKFEGVQLNKLIAAQRLSEETRYNCNKITK
ncbi:hypothetical protein ACLKA7_002035 [Drosophila subpalustris]